MLSIDKRQCDRFTHVAQILYLADHVVDSCTDIRENGLCREQFVAGEDRAQAVVVRILLEVIQNCACIAREPAQERGNSLNMLLHYRKNLYFVFLFNFVIREGHIREAP